MEFTLVVVLTIIIKRIITDITLFKDIMTIKKRDAYAVASSQDVSL